MEIKYQILIHLPLSCVRFIVDDYFWMLYCKEYSVSRRFSQLSWKSNYIIDSVCGNDCKHVITLYGSVLYFGHINSTKQMVDYRVEGGKCFHVFRLSNIYDQKNILDCLESYAIFREDNDNSISEVTPQLAFPIRQYANESGLFGMIKTNCYNRKSLYSFVGLIDRIWKTDSISKSDSVTKFSFINRCDVAVCVLIPQNCPCNWKNSDDTGLTPLAYKNRDFYDRDSLYELVFYEEFNNFIKLLPNPFDKYMRNTFLATEMSIMFYTSEGQRVDWYQIE